MRDRNRRGAERPGCRGPLRARRRRDSPLLGEAAAWSKSRTTIPTVSTRRFRGLPRSSISREFSSRNRIRLMSRPTLSQPVASWNPRSEAGWKKSFWSAQREPMKNLQPLLPHQRAGGGSGAASGLGYTILRAPLLLGPLPGAAALARNASAESQVDRRRPQFSAASLCGRPGAGCGRRDATLGRVQ